uniref:Uncharacterized protein n=1 Tax=viral metagenome TaxID=1070528 RepID=A0A6C0HTT8_9ZZZZ
MTKEDKEIIASNVFAKILENSTSNTLNRSFAESVADIDTIQPRENN